MGLFNKADILLPNDNIDLKKWSVIACDQYTSEPEYWKKAEEIVGKNASTLNLVFPEVYLDEGQERIDKINKTMEEYLEKGTFKEIKNSIIYVERTQSDGRVRKGLIGSIDLEEYDFSKGSNSKIRATEGTVLERIPPRVKIRENASLELPHILLLMNDAKNCIISSVIKGEKLYDFELMQNGGHLAGYKPKNADSVIEMINTLSKNADGNLFFAVGDGNHSLATAKTCWENIKKNLSEKEIENHPARYCLVEIENIHDSALDFEPIHRVVFDIDAKLVLDGLKNYYGDVSNTDNGGQKIIAIYENGEETLFIKNSHSSLSVGTLQNYLDTLNIKVDYIHGEDVTRKLGSQKGNMGFLLPKMDKNDLFSAVINDGALPRKTFSMGEAHDKRFYFEAKKIK